MVTTGHSQAGVPAFAGVEHFVEAFDRLVVQPRRRRSRVPVVLLSEPGQGRDGQRIVAGLYRRLLGRETRLASHAYLRGSGDPAWTPPEDPVLGRLYLFSQLTRQLMETMPRGTGKLRLPCYQLLRSIVTAPPVEGLGDRHHSELKDHAYAGHREVSSLARVLWWLGGRDQASGGTLLELLWNFVAGPLFQRLPRAVYVRRANRLMLGNSRRQRWYAEWARLQQGTPPTDFFRSARDLVHGGDAEQFDRILVHALLADLDSACRKRLLNPWRRRRVCRFVLLVAEAGGENSREQRFLRELRSATEDLRCTSVVAVAAGVRSLAHRIPDIEVATLSAAGAELANVAEHGSAPGSPTGMVVPVVDAGADDDPAATYWLRRRPTLAPPSKRWGPRAEIVGTVGVLALVLALTGISLGPLGKADADACRGSTFLGTDGQCVGVAEGAASFGKDSGDRALRDVLERIERQNGEMDKELSGRTDTGGPAGRTVVYFGPLSGGKDAEDPVRGGTLAELRGIAIAQGQVNAQALRSGERVPLRVLAANAGDRFKDAPDVARRVVRLAERDRSIVGVVGFGQSRRKTYEAVRIFGDAGIPMVGTSGTADALLQQSGHYYQMAPTDSRAAAVMASFARHAPMAAGGKPVRRVQLIADPADAYSASLAASFREEYGAKGTDVLLYTPADAPEPPPASRGLSGSELPAVEDLARQVCGAVAREPRTAVVWAARGSQFHPFLSEIARISRDCPKVVVLGDDDLTTALSEERRPWEVFGGLSLYYVSHGRAAALAQDSGEAAAFLSAYDAAYGKDESTRTSTMRDDAHVAIGWDAMRYLAEGVDQAWRGTGGHDERLDRGLLQGVLYQGLGGGGFDGATGRIDAHGAAGGGRLTEKKLLGVERDGKNGPRTVLLCGMVARGDTRAEWGDGSHPCP
ncbi:ABC transporter substrate-binding protein [Streptomyces lasiicapitis]|uniref:ABC transporter substrate-binding protein n=1 Tax=Streptomyces lasiicapitis TaxID=1923961 RepID=UPI00365AB532